jgi:hypothetical protein
MKGSAFVSGIVAFMGALGSGCQKAPDDMKIILHDLPELRYSKTPIKRVVIWYFTDDPGGHLRIYGDRHDDPTDGTLFDVQLSREAIEQVARTKQIIVEFDGGTSKTLPVTISNNKYSRNDRLVKFRP